MSLDPRALHSFPTRRSSDLGAGLDEAATVLPVVALVFESKAEQEQQVVEVPRGAAVSETHAQAVCHCHHASTDCRGRAGRSEEHTSELQSQSNLVCRLLLEK